MNSICFRICKLMFIILKAQKFNAIRIFYFMYICTLLYSSSSIERVKKLVLKEVVEITMKENTNEE